MKDLPPDLNLNVVGGLPVVRKRGEPPPKGEKPLFPDNGQAAGYVEYLSLAVMPSMRASTPGSESLATQRPAVTFCGSLGGLRFIPIRTRHRIFSQARAPECST